MNPNRNRTPRPDDGTAGSGPELTPALTKATTTTWSECQAWLNLFVFQILNGTSDTITILNSEFYWCRPSTLIPFLIRYTNFMSSFAIPSSFCFSDIHHDPSFFLFCLSSLKKKEVDEKTPFSRLLWTLRRIDSIEYRPFSFITIDLALPSFPFFAHIRIGISFLGLDRISRIFDYTGNIFS